MLCKQSEKEQGRKRPLDTPKRMIERYREGGRDKRERDRCKGYRERE